MNDIHTNRFYTILNNFFAKRYSKELEDRIYRWMANPENAEEKQEAMRRIWDSLDEIKDASTNAEYRKIIRILNENKENGVRDQQKRRIRRYIPFVAAVLTSLIILAGIYFFDSQKEINQATSIAVITVPYGQFQETTLSCGSDVWVNAGSEISYNEDWNSDSMRVLNLKGEAYLSVKHRDSIPFVVRTNYLDVRVLGTQFNVSAYTGDESTIVTLNEGSILIHTLDGRNFTLIPNQQLVYNNSTGEVALEYIDAKTVNDIAGWTTGEIAFNNETLKKIINTLERSLDVKIEVDKGVDCLRRYTLKLDVKDNLQDIVGVFEYLDNSLSYRVENNKIYISNNKTE